VLSPVSIVDYANGVRESSCSRNLSSLAIGGSTTYGCSHTGETVSYTNFVSAAGRAPDGTYVYRNASAHVTVIPAAPAIRVTKLPANQSVSSGGTATWTITVSDTGNTNLNNIQILDSPAPECARNLATVLSPGGSTSFTCSHGGETASYFNIVSAIGYAPDGTQVMNNASARVTVIAGGQPLAADFSGSPPSGRAPLTVQFTDQSAGNPSGWSWDFGDGGASSQRSPSHIYRTTGTYTVTLRVSDTNRQDTESKTGYITAGTSSSTLPVAGFTAAPLSGSVPMTVIFRDQSTGRPTSWSWDYGDGGHGVGRIGVHVYRRAGTYTVTLTVTNANGQDEETKVDYITVARQR